LAPVLFYVGRGLPTPVAAQCLYGFVSVTFLAYSVSQK
jgi:hypothetical protein